VCWRAAQPLSRPRHRRHPPKSLPPPKSTWALPSSACSGHAPGVGATRNSKRCKTAAFNESPEMYRGYTRYTPTHWECEESRAHLSKKRRFLRGMVGTEESIQKMA